LLIPLADNEHQPFPPSHFTQLREELIEQFGGLTAYTRSPAEGTWSPDDDSRDRDEIVVYEVMTESLDRDWWSRYRKTLERRFRQDDIVIRSQTVERL
jgi:hypothetical protein